MERLSLERVLQPGAGTVDPSGVSRSTALALVALALLMAAPAGAAPARADRALVFFSSRCLGCRTEAEQIRAWRSIHPTLPTVGVGFLEGHDSAAKFAADEHLVFPVVGDSSGELARRYRVAQPDAILLLRKGRVISRAQLQIP